MSEKDITESDVGHASRLREAFMEFRPALLKFLCSRLHCAADAEDIVQEAYLRIERIRDPHRIERPECYFFQIVKNLSVETQIKQNKSIELMDLDKLILTENDALQIDLDHQALQARYALQRLDAIFDELPELYAAILLLRKRDGYSHSEIAEKLGISKSTVHVYLTRALAQCREHLDKNE